MSDDQTTLRIAYTSLKALRDNLPDGSYVTENYVRQYHEQLDSLARMGLVVDRFRIPASEVKRRAVGGNYLDGTVDYGDVPEVERSFFLAKLDAILNFFNLSANKTQIGFST